MRNAPLILSLSLLGLGLSDPAQARIRYDRPINIITSNYDLVDTTYIDRGRLDGVKVGDKFEVKFRDGKLATQVVVTGVFERMASVKILDSWLLKDGQLGTFEQRPMVAALQNKARRPAPDITVKAKSAAPAAAPAQTSAPAAAPEAPAASPDMPPSAPGGEPGMPEMPGAETGLPGEADAGLPPSPDAGMDGGLPPSPDAGLPPSPDAGMDGGLPPSPDAGLPPSPDAGGDMGLPPSPDAGLPPSPDAGGMDIPPPPM